MVDAVLVTGPIDHVVIPQTETTDTLRIPFDPERENGDWKCGGSSSLFS